MASTPGVRGALIVFEGCDRCGKTTQTEKLVKYLNSKGSPAQLIKFPDRSTVIGAVIDSYLKSGTDLSDEAIHLLFSANRWEAVHKMENLLNSGKSLIVDRYAYSGVAFTSAKGLSLNWCKQPDVGLPKPDAVFYLDLPPAEAIERGGYGNERYEKQAFQENVLKTFLKLRDPTWTIVDARQTIEDIERQLRDLAEKALKSISANKPIGKLWAEQEESGHVIDGQGDDVANGLANGF